MLVFAFHAPDILFTPTSATHSTRGVVGSGKEANIQEEKCGETGFILLCTIVAPPEEIIIKHSTFIR